MLLTDEGKALLAQVAPLWQALAATLESAGGERQAPAGVVRVTMIPGFGRQMLMPLIPQFLARYPQIDLDLSLDARVVNLVGEGFDVGIGSRVDPDSRLVARPLYPMHMALAASLTIWHGTVNRKRRTTCCGTTACGTATPATAATSNGSCAIRAKRWRWI